MDKINSKVVANFRKFFASKRNQDNDISVPPTKHSPKNIVNILNDDCIQAILLKLDNVRDFFRAAQVCIRFQENAKICFPFKDIQFISNKYSKSDGSNQIHIVDINVECFLSIFGPHIKSIVACGKFDLDLISKYCGQTLNKLVISFSQIHVWKLRTPFPALKNLFLGSISLDVPGSTLILFPEVRILSITRGRNTDMLKHNYPKLQHLYFLDVTLPDDILIEFQSRHTQLEGLKLTQCTTSPALLKDIGNRLPNITHLDLSAIHDYEDIVHIGTLRQLKSLLIESWWSSKKLISLFSVFVENNHPLEVLGIGNVNWELAGLIQQLKTIKHLYIDNTAEDIVIDIARKLPDLVYLLIGRIWNVVTTLKEILQQCKNLTELNCRCRDLIIDWHGYNTIVALATGRIKIHIKYDYNEDMERTVMEMNTMEQITQKENEWVHFLECYIMFHHVFLSRCTNPFRTFRKYRC